MEANQARVKALKIKLNEEQVEIKILERELQTWNNYKTEGELVVQMRLSKDQVNSMRSITPRVTYVYSTTVYTHHNMLSCHVSKFLDTN